MKHFANVRKYAAKIITQPRVAAAVFIGGCVTGFAAHAEDYTTLITGAQTDATGNQKAVIAAVIAIAVISFGAGAFLMWLRK